MTKAKGINNWLCKIGLHKWGNTWHVTQGGKVAMFEWMVDVWTGYHKCERCPRTKCRTEFVHTEPLYRWERKRNG